MNLLVNGQFQQGMFGWEKEDPLDALRVVTGASTCLRYQRHNTQSLHNTCIFQTYAWHTVGYYRLTIRYRTDGRCAPTILLHRLKTAGLPGNPSYIIRLPANRDWHVVQQDLLSVPWDTQQPMQLRLYPGTYDQLRMDETTSGTCQFTAAGFHPGWMEVASLHMEPLSVPVCWSQPGPYAVHTRQDAYPNTTAGNLPVWIDEPVGGKNADLPVFIWIHGGGWIRGHPDEIIEPAHYFTTRGYTCIRPAYRLIGQGGNIDTAMQDLHALVHWIKHQAALGECNRQRILIGGVSAGAHLGALLARQISACTGFVGLAGLYDIVHKGDGNFGRSALFLKGSSLSDWQRASPIHQLDFPVVPSLLVAGEMDPAIDRTQAVRFAQSIQQTGGLAKALIVPHMNHSISPTAELWHEIQAFVERQAVAQNVESF